MSEETTSTSIETPLGKLSFNGRNTTQFIVVLSLVALGILSYVLFDHKVEAGEFSRELKATLKENQREQTKNLERLTEVIRDQGKEQRFQTCVLSLPLDQRSEQLNNPNSFCNRLIR